MRKLLPVLSFFALFALLFSFSPEAGKPRIAQAQGGQDIWTQPVNISNSGAASEPRLLAGPDGALQAFWIDRFDGLMTALYNGSTWSFPTQSGIVNLRLGQGPTKITEIPAFVSDNAGRLFAFSYGAKSKITEESPLLFSQMQFGSTLWPIFQQVAESARVFDPNIAGDGEIKLAYVRPLKSGPTFTTLETEPGVYLRSTINRASAWKAPIPVDLSVYYRILDSEQAFLQAAGSGSFISLAWFEPRLEQVLTADSSDGGVTWTQPQLIGASDSQPFNVLLTTMPDGRLLRIWQDAAQPGCVLYQQYLTLPLASAEPTPTPTRGPTPTAGPVAPTAEWSQPQQALLDVQTCPSNSQFLIAEQTLYWVWGEGSSVLNLSAWDAVNARWSLPQTFAFSFEDPSTGRLVQLENLHTTLSSDRLAVIGWDEDGSEVWVTHTQVSAFEIAFAPPSPWNIPERLSPESGSASNPIVAMDAQGRAHIAWSQGDPGTSLFYARFDDQGASSPSQIVKAASGEIVRQPALIVDSQERLHLAWSGGVSGQLYYSRAVADQAGSAGGWLPAKRLDTAANITRPQIATDASGRIFVLYIVPINEGRGVYLVHSSDSGDTWSHPTLIFDASAAGWEGVEYPALLAAPDGSLFAAFARLVLASLSPTEGLYFSRTTASPHEGDFETSWAEPVEVASSGAVWPRLALVSNQLHLLYLNSNGLQQRWVLLEQITPDGLGWGGESRVPGWQDLTWGSQPPFALANDALTLHLVGPQPGVDSLRYSTWSVPASNPTSGRWGTVETYAPLGYWSNQGSVAAAARPSGGKLAIAWLALPPQKQAGTPAPSLPALYFTLREIGTIEALPTPTTFPISGATQAPTETPTQTPQPTATLSPNLPPTPDAQPLSPMVVGGALATLIVLIIFTAILFRQQSR